MTNENPTIDDFYAIGLGFTEPPKENKNKVVEDNTTNNNIEYTFIDSIHENNEDADNLIDKCKEKSDIICETIENRDDNSSNESYKVLLGFKKKDFSLEDAYESVLMTSDINEASYTELKAIGNMLILLSKNSLTINSQNYELFNEKEPSSIILENMKKSRNEVLCHNSYLHYISNSTEEILKNLLNFITKFDNKDSDIGNIVGSLQLLGDKILNLFDKLVPSIKIDIISNTLTIGEKLEKLSNILKNSDKNIILYELFGVTKVSNAPINNVIDNIEGLNNLLYSRKCIIDLCLSDDMTSGIENIKSITEKQDLSISMNDKILIEKITNVVYQFSKIIIEFINDLSEDCKLLCEYLGRKWESDKDIKSKEDLDNETPNDPFVVSDYHLLDDLISGDQDLTKSNSIIEKHNKYITPNDDVIFLGDVSGSETFAKGNEQLPEKLKEFCKKLNHRHMSLIIGNNDYSSQEDFYRKCGFDKVYDKPVLLDDPVFKPFGENSKIMLSHEPVEVDDNTLNIHGHLHGCKKYFNINPKNHIDVFYGLYYRPMRLSELIQYFKSGKYNGLTRIDNIHKE